MFELDGLEIKNLWGANKSLNSISVFGIGRGAAKATSNPFSISIFIEVCASSINFELIIFDSNNHFSKFTTGSLAAHDACNPSG